MIPPQSQSAVLELPWPEPLVIEMIDEHLEPQPLTFATRRALARQHAAALRDMVVGGDPSWRVSRQRLSQRYGELGIASACSATVDRAVIYELARIVAERFRTSPRRRNEAAKILRAAIGQLPDIAGSPHRVAA